MPISFVLSSVRPLFVFFFFLIMRPPPISPLFPHPPLSRFVLLARPAGGGLVPPAPRPGAAVGRGRFLPRGAPRPPRRSRGLAVRLDGRLRPPLGQWRQGG